MAFSRIYTLAELHDNGLLAQQRVYQSININVNLCADYYVHMQIITYMCIWDSQSMHTQRGFLSYSSHTHKCM